MDSSHGVYAPFNSFCQLHVSGQWEGNKKRLCAKERRFLVEKICASPPAVIEQSNTSVYHAEHDGNVSIGSRDMTRLRLADDIDPVGR